MVEGAAKLKGPRRPFSGGKMRKALVFGVGVILLFCAVAVAMIFTDTVGFSRCVLAQPGGFLPPNFEDLIWNYSGCVAAVARAQLLPLSILLVFLCGALGVLFWRQSPPRPKKRNDMRQPGLPAAQKVLRLNDQAAASSGPPSLISFGVDLVGDLNAKGELQIDGSVKGNISCGRLIISENGTVNGDVFADHVVIRGKLHGHLKASYVVLSNGSEIEADVEQLTLTVEPGAKFTGSVRSMARELSAFQVVDPETVMPAPDVAKLFG
jgi:cytoskeletal protein CcmA (bactofilin family)